MSSFNLTRIVTFTPFYTIANKSSLELEVGEIGPNGSFPTNKWNYISTSEVMFEIFFPLDVTVDKQLVSSCHLRKKKFSYGSSVTCDGMTWILHILWQLEQHWIVYVGKLIKSFNLGNL